MSIALPSAQLSREMRQLILKGLCFQAKDLYPIPGVQRKPVMFYLSVGDNVLLPYWFARYALGISPAPAASYPPVAIGFKGELYPYQQEATLEALEQLHRVGCTTLALYTGFGKTVLGARLSSALSLLTVVLVHRELLLSQWKKSYETSTDAIVWIVGEKPPPTANVIICMDTRVALLPEEYRKRVGLLIVDEAHAYCTPCHVAPLLLFSPRYIVAESATPRRDDGMHSMLEALCGPEMVYRASPKRLSVIKMETGVRPESRERDGRLDWPHLLKTSLFRPERNELIVSIVRKYQQEKVLVLTRLVDHALLLTDMLNQAGIKADSLCGKKSSYNDSQALVGTLSKIGTGFDEALACPDFSGVRIKVLLMCASIKKLTALEQAVGRVRHPQPVIIHLVDEHAVFHKHWSMAHKWYTQKGAQLSSQLAP